MTLDHIFEVIWIRNRDPVFWHSTSYDT